MSNSEQALYERMREYHRTPPPLPAHVTVCPVCHALVSSWHVNGEPVYLLQHIEWHDGRGDLAEE